MWLSASSFLSRHQSNSARTRDNRPTMLMRIYRLLEDARYEFLFGPNSSEWPEIINSLAAFIRDILGLESNSDAELTDEDGLAEGILPFYDRQRAGAEASNVVIVDLSLLVSEVLENVTALAPRNALVLGECVRAPVLVEMRNVIRFHEAKTRNSSRAGQMIP